jgi:hypothetical protein
MQDSHNSRLRRTNKAADRCLQLRQFHELPEVWGRCDFPQAQAEILLTLQEVRKPLSVAQRYLRLEDLSLACDTVIEPIARDFGTVTYSERAREFVVLRATADIGDDTHAVADGLLRQRLRRDERQGLGIGSHPGGVVVCHEVPHRSSTIAT